MSLEFSLREQIMDMVDFDILSEQDIDLIIAVELLKLKKNKALIGRRTERIDWMAESKILSTSALCKGYSILTCVFPPPGWLRWE